MRGSFSRSRGQPASQGPFDPAFEHDACGVGMVCNIQGTASHAIVAQGLTILRNLAQRFNFVDNPQARKVHARPMPMLGGVAIYLGLSVAMIVGGNSSFVELLGILGGATVMTLFGLWDDRVTLGPLPKLLGQFLASAILIAAGVQIRLFASQALNVAITLVWVVGISNALNFQDNMDGLAAGLATVSSGFFFILAIVEGLGLTLDRLRMAR